MGKSDRHSDNLISADLLSNLEEIKEIELRLKNEINKIPYFKMPPFKMPNWPDFEDADVDISLGLRRVWLLENLYGGRKILKAKKRLLVLNVRISRDGKINITLRHPLDLRNKLEFYSISTSPEMALQCFIIFSQFIEQIAKRSLAILRNDQAMRKLDKERFLILMDSVERTFESLVPFIMADELAG